MPPLVDLKSTMMLKRLSASVLDTQYEVHDFCPSPPTGYDSPDGDLFRLQFDPSSSVPALMQLLDAADKVPNCIAFNSSGHLKAALTPRANWVLVEDGSASSSGAVGHPVGASHEHAGLYVRSQCLPFLEAGCSSWGEHSALGGARPDS